MVSDVGDGQWTAGARGWPEPAERASGMSQQIAELVEWFSDHSPERGAREEMLLWCAKVTEEAGEVSEAVVGALDFNPRKGMTHALTDVHKELLDVALTALCAHHALTGQLPMRSLAEHVNRAHARIGTTVAGGQR